MPYVVVCEGPGVESGSQEQQIQDDKNLEGIVDEQCAWVGEGAGRLVGRLVLHVCTG